MKYYDFDPELPRLCAACGASAPPSVELFTELLQVDCARCDAQLFLVLFPTAEDVREAAAAGNVEAQQELVVVEKREARLERADDAELRHGAPLPELPGDELVVDWDMEERDGDVRTVLRHGEVELWCEYAFWEGYERFEEVARILYDRYDTRFRELRPTPRSETYLYGDQLSAPDRIAKINAGLREGLRP